MLELKGKKALVLASSQGIGKGIAQQLAAKGAEVLISARREEVLAEVFQQIGAKGYIVGDLSKPQEGERLVEEAASRLGGLDILITNAGGPPAGNFEEITEEDWRFGFQSLFLAVRDSVLAALPHMRKRGYGRIVCITSTTAKEPIPKLTVSNSIRPGIHGLIKSVSSEIASSGITINAIMPGFIETERLQELGHSLEKLLGEVPVGRLGTVEELGDFAAFLCGPEGAYLTGQAFAFDGGKLRGF